MKILLRSMIVVNPTVDDAENAFRNYLKFNDSGLGFDIPTDIVLWEFVKVFAQSHNHTPQVATIRTHFTALQEVEVLDRLEILLTNKPIYRGDFIRRLEERANDRRTVLVREMLKEAHQILQHGREDKTGKETKHLRGPLDAVHFFVTKSHDIVTPTTGMRLSGEVTRDGANAWQRYQRVKADPLSGIGHFCGIRPIDEKLKGAKRGQLWTHAAFTGHGKSVLSRNWAYNQAVYGGHDSVIFSLEMPYDQCRTSFYTLHSLHPKFRDIRMKMGIQPRRDVTMGLSYEKIMDGELSTAEEKFYHDMVIPDFASDEHGKVHIEVTDPDKDDFTVVDIKMKAELIYSKDPFSLIFVDHAGLIQPRKHMRSTTENLNSVIRDHKRLSMSFNRGAGIPIVCLFQISREGFKAAAKPNSGGGLYNLTHLSYANEAERSSDIVTTSWAPEDMRAANRIQFQCLKSRDRAPFETFQCRCEWHNHRIYGMDIIGMTDDEKIETGEQIDDGLDDF